MSNLHKLKRRAAELEQKQQFDRAIELYMQLLDEAGKELPDDDVPLYNRVGDLLVRRGQMGDALTYYERAVDLYAERGFLNNAIALCSKILRQSPGRASIYYKLGRISARKGFKSDARKNFLEYADRMQKSGQLDEAFRALKEFAALYPDQDDIRLILADLLSRENRKGEALEQLQALHEKLQAEGRGMEARATFDRMKAIDPEVQPRVSGVQAAQAPNALVFLDVSPELGPPRSETPSRAAPERRTTGPQGLAPALDGLRVTFVPEHAEEDRPRPTSAPTSAPESIPAAAPEEAPEPVAMIEGFEATATTPVTPPGTLEQIDRTGDFAAVEPPFEAVEPTESVESAIRELEREAELAPPVEGFEATAIDLGDEATPEAPEADAADDDAAPLSVSEFEELPLAEVARSAGERRHDLALPSALPRLGADASVDRDGGTAVETPAATTPVEPAPAAVEAWQDSRADVEAEAVDASLTSEIPAIEDLAVVPRSEPVATPPASEVTAPHGDDAEEPDDTFHPPTDDATLDDEPEYTPPVPTPEDDLLAAAPSFGIQPSDEIPAFPPIAGLSDDVAITGGRTAPEPPELELPEQYSVLADDTFDPGAFDAPSFTPSEATPVSAAVPEGLEATAEVPAHTVAPEADAAPAPERWETPKSTVSLGGAEGHLRRRLELEPDNWALHRQLGETLLEAGDREGGLEELERAMAGFDAAGELDRANETAEEIIRVQPGSVRHHQKRVEYAVRAKDRARLISAYLDLADALFRSGAGDKSVVVYARVAELDPGNERAEFALSTLAPDRAPSSRPTPASAGRWSQELDAIDAPAAPAAPVAPAAAVAQAGPVVSAPLRREVATPTLVPIEALAPADDSPPEAVEPPAAPAPHAGEPASGGSDALRAASEGPPPPTDGWRTPAPAAAQPEESAPARTARPRPRAADRDGFVDLGEWLRESEPVRTTRMVVQEARPTGDEAADFAELLRRFKRGLAENVDPEDFEAHYDLGVAFKEMGLMEEAIAEFQKSLRGSTHRVRSYEALGQCFVETGQYQIAAALLQRAVETTRVDDQELVGVLYLLGYACEQLGRHADALRYYQRVFSVDIQFRDIAQRVSSMEHLTK